MTNDTGMVIPWSEPSYTQTTPDAYKRDLRMVQRAMRLASTSTTWTCPHCHTPWPGVNYEGRTRRGCPDPHCAGRARGDRARALGRHRQVHLTPEVVQAIRDTYEPGVTGRGYRALAHVHGIDPSTVRDIVTGRTHKE